GDRELEVERGARRERRPCARRPALPRAVRAGGRAARRRVVVRRGAACVRRLAGARGGGPRAVLVAGANARPAVAARLVLHGVRDATARDLVHAERVGAPRPARSAAVREAGRLLRPARAALAREDLVDDGAGRSLFGRGLARVHGAALLG